MQTVENSHKARIVRSVVCPRCGRDVRLHPHPTRKGRVRAKCRCHPAPFLETDAGGSESAWKGDAPHRLYGGVYLGDVPGVSRRAAIALFEAGFRTLGDVVGTPDSELIEIPRVGVRTIQHIRARIIELRKKEA